MTSTSRIAGRAVAWTAVATLGVGAIAGVALAATGTSPSPSASTKAGTSAHAKGPDRAKHPGRLSAATRRAVHGELVVKGKDGKYVTIDTQRGSVTAVSPTSITVRSADGFSATYAVGSGTRVRKDGKKAAVGDLKVGDAALVMSLKGADGKTARSIVVRAPRATPGKQD
jgi:hypothetical protein